MPVTARLSRRFYEKFGDDIVNELVELLNQVDATYRSELRDQNETNFARFDAKLEQRLVELDAKWGQRWADLRTEMAAMRADLIKWMFLFWAPTALAVVGTGVGVVSLLLRR